MKALLVLLGLIAVASSYPKVKLYTLKDAEAAMTDANPVLKQHLEDIINTIMYALFTGDEKRVMAMVPSPSGYANWTVGELQSAIEDPGTNPSFLEAIKNLYQQYEWNGRRKDMYVFVPSMDLTTWTKLDLLKALHNQHTHPDLMPLVAQALKEFHEASRGANGQKTISIVVPVGLVPPPEGQYDQDPVALMYLPEEVREKMGMKK